MTDNLMWVFGYGSLIWQPGFEPAARRLARLDGWHRSFCMRSVHHRGTPEDPGLVLALDRAAAAACHGVAYAVRPGEEPAVMAYLRERELVSSAYLETVQTVAFEDGGGTVEAVTYVIDPDHEQYCGGLAREEQARIIAAATGGRGPNSDYLFNTAAHLAELGLPDPDLEWLSARVRALLAGH